jgi:hypothetical protein
VQSLTLEYCTAANSPQIALLKIKSFYHICCYYQSLNLVRHADLHFFKVPSHLFLRCKRDELSMSVQELLNYTSEAQPCTLEEPTGLLEGAHLVALKNKMVGWKHGTRFKLLQLAR